MWLSQITNIYIQRKRERKLYLFTLLMYKNKKFIKKEQKLDLYT